MKGSLMGWEGPRPNCYRPRKRGGSGGWDAQYSFPSFTYELSLAVLKQGHEEHVQGCLL